MNWELESRPMGFPWILREFQLAQVAARVSQLLGLTES